MDAHRRALVAHGVPRATEDVDVFVDSGAIEGFAHDLVDIFGWTPLVYDSAADDYVVAAAPAAHFMDDPVLFDIGEERLLIPLRSAHGYSVELLAAQHPVEKAMLDFAVRMNYRGVLVPVAPLGGVLLVKVKADRVKDTAAIEQTAEHLSAQAVQDARSATTRRRRRIFEQRSLRRARGASPSARTRTRRGSAEKRKGRSLSAAGPSCLERGLLGGTAQRYHRARRAR